MHRRPILSAGRRTSCIWGALPAGLAALARSTTATTTAGTATAAPATTAASLGFRPSLVDIERTAIEIGTIQGRNGAVRFGGVRHFHERKTARAAGVAVGYEVDTIHLSVRLKERTDGRFSCCEIQIAYKDVFHIVVMSFNRAARLGRFGPQPGCCRTLKRLFQYSRTLPTATSPRRPKSSRGSTCLPALPLPGSPCSRHPWRTGGSGSAPSNCFRRQNPTSRPSPCP